MQDKVRMLVGVDGSENSRRALSEAVSLAKKFSGYLKVITVYGRRNENKAKEIIEEAKQFLAESKIEYTTSTILGSNPA